MLFVFKDDLRRVSRQQAKGKEEKETLTSKIGLLYLNWSILVKDGDSTQFSIHFLLIL